jgi:hypothetical protein
MAKIRFGPTIEDIRGSAGPINYSRNTAAHYIAQRATKTAPATTAATTARATFAAASQAWRALTPAQRTDWNALAAAPPENDYDPWAVQKFCTGFTWFVRVYTRQVATTETPPTDPPTDAQPDPPTITAATIAAYGSTNQSSYLAYTTPATNYIENPDLEAPYTAGKADTWLCTAVLDPYLSEETADLYNGASAQKCANPGNIAANRFRSATFTLPAATRFHLLYANKILTSHISYIRLYTVADGDISVESHLHERPWTPVLYPFTTTIETTGYFGPYQSNVSAGTWLLDDTAIRPAEHFILSAAINPSPGRQTPDHAYRILYAGPPPSASRLFIGDALVTLFGAYPAGWTVFLKLARQSISGLRSTPVLFTTTTG